MKRLLVIAVCALVFITTSAYAADKGMYYSGYLGFSMASDSDLSTGGMDIADISFNPGFNIGGALGYNYGNIRSEIEIGFHRWDIDEATLSAFFPGCPCTGARQGDYSAVSFMVNGYYDYHRANSSIGPFLGGGIGFANVDVGFAGFPDDADIVFAYQFMAGIGIEINPSMIFTVGYRYFTTADNDFDGFEATITSHDFSLGARLMF